MLFSSRSSSFLSLFTKLSATKSSMLTSAKSSGSMGTSKPAALRFFLDAPALPPLALSALRRL